MSLFSHDSEYSDEEKHPYRYKKEIRRQHCPVCKGNTNCLIDCPGDEIDKKLSEIRQLMDKWIRR